MRQVNNFWKYFLRIALIFALIAIITRECHGQDNPKFFNWWKLAQYSTSALAGALSSHADWNCKWKEGTVPPERIELDRKYHNYQTAERFSLIVTGITIPLSAKGKFWHMVSDLAVSTALFGFMHNGVSSLILDKHWFYQSEYQKNNNTSGFEQLASWQWQIGGLLFTIMVNYLVYEVF